MLYRHVFDKISTEFRGISHVFEINILILPSYFKTYEDFEVN